MVSRPYEGIVSKVAADVSLDDLPSDAIARDKVFVLAFAGIITMAASHCVQGKPVEIRSSTRGKWPKGNPGWVIKKFWGPKWEKTVEPSLSGLLIDRGEREIENRSIGLGPGIQRKANKG